MAVRMADNGPVSELTDVTRTLARQIAAHGLRPKMTVILEDGLSLRFAWYGRANHTADVRYDIGLDLYEVTIHRHKRDLSLVSKTYNMVYVDQLGEALREWTA